MIYLNRRLTMGFALGDDSSERLHAALIEVLKSVKAFGEALTPREKLILEIGLTASHMEESLAHGDWKRAEAHMEKLAALSERFAGPPGTATEGGAPP